MNNKYEIKDILSAIDVLLNNKEKEVMRLVSEVDVEKPFLLKDKAKKSKKKNDSVPKNTEKIILQAEKYLKK